MTQCIGCTSETNVVVIAIVISHIYKYMYACCLLYIVMKPFDLSDHKTPNKRKITLSNLDHFMLTLNKIIQFDLGICLIDIEKYTL